MSGSGRVGSGATRVLTKLKWFFFFFFNEIITGLTSLTQPDEFPKWRSLNPYKRTSNKSKAVSNRGALSSPNQALSGWPKPRPAKNV